MNPIGQVLRTHPEPKYPATLYQIIGVIADTKYDSLRGDKPVMTFAPASQFPAFRPWTAIMVHSTLAPEVAAQSIKRRLTDRHPGIIVGGGSFQARIQDGLARERMMAMLSGFFGLLAALLAMVGLYGVISYVVNHRRNEIGIRIAVGADRSQVVGMVMREACLLLIVEVSIGTILALAVGRGAGSLLFELKPYDPFTLATSILLLTVVGALASFLPSLRASRLDAIDALRCD